MKISKCDNFEGLLLIELKIHHDNRGFFIERYNEKLYQELGLNTTYVQDNHSRSLPNVIRGLHCQFNPNQGKLVGVISGKIWDVAVDIRENSPTYGKHFSVELSDTNGKLLWIPHGFLHGFANIGDSAADVFYKVDNYFAVGKECGIFWQDPDLNIPWPLKNPIISDKDKILGSFADYKSNPLSW
jgi:dTDP-4-dehydrorhamnose 3,5-epimerase